MQRYFSFVGNALSRTAVKGCGSVVPGMASRNGSYRRHPLKAARENLSAMPDKALPARLVTSSAFFGPRRCCSCLAGFRGGRFAHARHVVNDA